MFSNTECLSYLSMGYNIGKNRTVVFIPRTSAQLPSWETESLNGLGLSLTPFLDLRTHPTLLLLRLFFNHYVVSDSLCPHGLQHATLPCPSPHPGVCSNLHSLNRWCHSTISSFVSPFCSCLVFPSIRVFIPFIPLYPTCLLPSFLQHPPSSCHSPMWLTLARVSSWVLGASAFVGPNLL